MFCYQCEQTAKGQACEKSGVCGKQPDVAALQDLLVHSISGLAEVAAEYGSDKETDAFISHALFMTLTNVNFNPDRFIPVIKDSVKLREKLKEKLRRAGSRAEFKSTASTFGPADNLAGLVAQGEGISLKSGSKTDPDILSLKHTLLFGLKGVAAYTDHARILDRTDDDLFKFIREGLASHTKQNIGMDEMLALVLRCGEMNLKAMELLDAANTGAYGHPVPTKVPLGTKKGKAILVSGHDLKDLKDILIQSEGKGIYVYTHGEMLPAHGYPVLKKYAHLYGHYGTAWQNQAKDFAAFPGTIVMTTNCIQKPVETYKDNIFTAGAVGWPGVKHIENGQYSEVIANALALPGFQSDKEGQSVTVGFARDAVMKVAGKIIESVKEGKIRHFFLVAGCDGAKPGRNYYTEFVERVPRDCIVLTLACGKFRFFDKKLGDIGGIPRLIDIGQCNDAYSAIQIAVALANAFKVGVNELPLSMVLSWYEQKAVSILLTLLHLGIKNIRLGPSLPAFITPTVLKILVQNFNIASIKTPEEDLQAILRSK